MSFLLFLIWVSLNSLLINIGIKAGWSHDPGYLGPALIVLSMHLICGLFASNRDK